MSDYEDWLSDDVWDIEGSLREEASPIYYEKHYVADVMTKLIGFYLRTGSCHTNPLTYFFDRNAIYFPSPMLDLGITYLQKIDWKITELKEVSEFQQSEMISAAILFLYQYMNRAKSVLPFLEKLLCIIQ